MEETEDVETMTSEKHSPQLSSTRYAPWYIVPNKHFVSIENPFIIKNVDKGIETMGGVNKLQEVVKIWPRHSEYGSDGMCSWSGTANEAVANLYLKPGDRMSKPLKSANVRTNDILLKVTVPKRTGLKRKRGAQGPYYEGLEEDGAASEESPQPPSTDKDAQYLMRIFRDHPRDYSIEPVGSIDHTHRFRGMPDFVYSTANSPFMQRMKEYILPFEYEKIKGFRLDMSKGVKPNTEIIPPPSFSHLDYPFNYSYLQNPSVKQVTDELGHTTMAKLDSLPKVWAQPLPSDIDTVPAGPPPDIPPIGSQLPAMQRLIVKARRLFEERPIFTRRALMNLLPDKDCNIVDQSSAKYVYQYVGYLWASGPWRDAVVRFGVDPRKDPECRKYQTMMFMLEKEPKDSRAKYSRPRPEPAKTEQIMRRESHLFDGRNVSMDGKVWQVCDITDPLLMGILATTTIRKECHRESDGWYHNGTWAKAKIIMKTKISAILDGVPPSHTALERIAKEMPEIIRLDDRASARLGNDATSEELRFATSVRSMAIASEKPRSGTITKDTGYKDDSEQDVDIGDEEQAEQDRESEEKRMGDNEIDDETEHDTETGDESEPEDETGNGVEQDDEIEMPQRPGTIDPRLHQVALELDKVEGGTKEIEGMVDGMDIDGGPSPTRR